MKTSTTLLGSLLLVHLALGFAPEPARAQPAAAATAIVIDSVEVHGIDTATLSPGLSLAISELSGSPLDRDALQALARRIEEERPGVVAAVRDITRQAGRVQVVFFVASQADADEFIENVNTRYVVAGVDVSGVPDDALSGELRRSLSAIEGAPIDPRELGRLTESFKTEFPTYDVSRRIVRAHEPGQIRIVFELRRSERQRWLPLASSRSKIVFHQNQKWSAVLDVPLGDRRGDYLASLELARGNNDDLVEEYSGIGFRFQNRNAGTERLGIRFDVSRYTQTWREQTEAAAAADPGLLLYRKRTTIRPTVLVALTRSLHAEAGVFAAELIPQEAGTPVRVNAGILGLGWRHRSRPGTGHSLRVDAGVTLHAGTANLDSDFVYRRWTGRTRVAVGTEQRSFIAEFRAGRLSAAAPLFERFSLGDTETLRGWNRYDLVPAGSDRMWHQSLEFRYEGFAYFIDSGSAWNAGALRKTRLATGVGFHGDHAFLTVGFPLNADTVRATVLFGVRF